MPGGPQWRGAGNRWMSFAAILMSDDVMNRTFMSLSGILTLLGHSCKTGYTHTHTHAHTHTDTHTHTHTHTDIHTLLHSNTYTNIHIQSLSPFLSIYLCTSLSLPLILSTATHGLSL